MNPDFELSWNNFTSQYSEWTLFCIWTFIIHEAVFFGSYIPFAIIDCIPAARQWKIQRSKVNDVKQQMGCLKGLLMAHFGMQFPMILLSHPTFKFMGSVTTSPLPSYTTIIQQVVIFMFIEDFLFYWIHRALHTRWLYEHIHYVHHTYSAPFGIAAEYAHPAETVTLGMATLAGPMIFGPHLLTLWIYLSVRLLQTVECHSGYDFPFSLNRIFPLYGGAEFHDLHHQTHTGNYASSFIWTDWLFGTDKNYRNLHEKLKKGVQGLR